MMSEDAIRITNTHTARLESRPQDINTERVMMLWQAFCSFTADKSSADGVIDVEIIECTHNLVELNVR